MKNNNESTYLVGDVRCTQNTPMLFEVSKCPSGFLSKLQDLMKEYGIVKLDISIDPIKYNSSPGRIDYKFGTGTTTESVNISRQ